MSDLQLLELALDGSTPLLELYELEVTAAPPPATGNVLRILELVLSGGGGGPVLEAGAVTSPSSYDPVAPGTQVTMSVVPTGDWTGIDWVLQAEGLAVEVAGGGTTVSFVAPYDPRGGDVLLAAVAHGPGGDSAPVLLSIGVVPHTEWHISGGTWVPTLSSDTLGD